jgi:hypothetical protein
MNRPFLVGHLHPVSPGLSLRKDSRDPMQVVAKLVPYGPPFDSRAKRALSNGALSEQRESKGAARFRFARSWQAEFR